MSFFEIFEPGLRHLREEKDRQKMLVSRPTPGGGAPLGIDLDGGKAKITLPAVRPAAASAEQDGTNPSTEGARTAPSDEAAGDGPSPDSAEVDRP